MESEAEPPAPIVPEAGPTPEAPIPETARAGEADASAAFVATPEAAPAAAPPLAAAPLDAAPVAAPPPSADPASSPWQQAPTTAVAAAPVAHAPASIRFLVIVTVISLAADLASKGWAKALLSGPDKKAHAKKLMILKDHVDFIFAQNPGGAWSFLRSLPDTLRRPFFLVVSAAAIVFIVSIYRRVHSDQTAMKWGLPLALGGAMGNLVDRIRYGWVVDFVDIYVTRGGREHHWPTFNVADIAIVVGVGLMAIDMMRSSSRHAHGPLKAGPASAHVPPAA